MSIKDALNYTVKTNSTGMKRPALSSEEDMDKQLAEMRRNNMRRAPGAASGAARPAAKAVKAPAAKTKPIVKERPVKVKNIDEELEEEMVSPVKEKIAKEKPVKEKPVKEKTLKEKPVKEKVVKEKPVKEKRGLFGRKKSSPEEDQDEIIDEDEDLFGDIDEDGNSAQDEDSDDLFSRDEMMSSMDNLFDEDDTKDSELEIRDIKDIEVKNIDEDKLNELERDGKERDMNRDLQVPKEEKEIPPGERKAVEKEQNAESREAGAKDKRKEQKKPLRKNDVFDSDGADEDEAFPDKSDDDPIENTMSDEDRTNVLRREIERNASGAMPVEEVREAEAAAENNAQAQAVKPPVQQQRRPAAARRRSAVTSQAMPPAGNAAGAPVQAARPVRVPRPVPGQAGQAQSPSPAPAKRPPMRAAQRTVNQNMADAPVQNNAAGDANTVNASNTRQLRRSAAERHAVNERKKEAGRREFESRRRNVSEDSFTETSFPLQIVSYAAVAIIVIVALVCAFRGVELNTLSPLVLGIISVIMVVMGIFLGMIPAFISLIIAALALIAGAVTGFFSEVITALVVLLATVTALKGRRG